VTIEYDGQKPVRLDTVVVSSQHAGDISLEELLTPDVRQHVIAPEDRGLALDTGTTGCWSTRPGGSRSGARWATPA
jgi:S-adenosylmethionine synthetase